MILKKYYKPIDAYKLVSIIKNNNLFDTKFKNIKEIYEELMFFIYSSQGDTIEFLDSINRGYYNIPKNICVIIDNNNIDIKIEDISLKNTKKYSYDQIMGLYIFMKNNKLIKKITEIEFKYHELMEEYSSLVEKLRFYSFKKSEEKYFKRTEKDTFNKAVNIINEYNKKYKIKINRF